MDDLADVFAKIVYTVAYGIYGGLNDGQILEFADKSVDTKLD